MAPSQLIEGQLGDAMEYMEEVDQSLQVCPLSNRALPSVWHVL